MSKYPSLTSQHDASLGGGTILDEDTIAALEELGGESDPGLLLELIDLFLEDAQQRMEEIRQATETGDMEAIGKAAHALKSASANLGALPFSTTCRDLEAKVREGDKGSVHTLSDSAHRLFEEVCRVLQQLRGEVA